MKLLPLSLFSLTFILVGCVHYKEYPFPYSKNIKLDSQLIGTWKFDNTKNDKNETDVLIFKKNKKINSFELYMESPKEKSSSKLQAYTVSLENNHYLNIQTEKTDNYNFMKYKVSGNKLTLWLLNDAPIATSIKNKEIHGDISSNMPVLPSTNIYVWENVTTIQKYILLHDKELFPKPTYLIRTQTPTSSK